MSYRIMRKAHLQKMTKIEKRTGKKKTMKKREEAYVLPKVECRRRGGEFLANMKEKRTLQKRYKSPAHRNTFSSVHNND